MFPVRRDFGVQQRGEVVWTATLAVCALPRVLHLTQFEVRGCRDEFQCRVGNYERAPTLSRESAEPNQAGPGGEYSQPLVAFSRGVPALRRRGVHGTTFQLATPAAFSIAQGILCIEDEKWSGDCGAGAFCGADRGVRQWWLNDDG